MKNKETRNEHQLLYKVLQHFDGMQKIDVFDLLHKIEVLLFYASSPLEQKDIIQIIQADRETSCDSCPFEFTMLPNGNICQFVGASDLPHIYKEQKRNFGFNSIFEAYYFKTKYEPLILTKLTKKNLLKSVKDTAEEIEILEFLGKNKITKKDKNTKRILLLDL